MTLITAHERSTNIRRYAADLQCSVPKSDTSLSVMATVPSSWPTAGASWPPTLDGGEGRHKIEQPTGGCSRSLAEASSCSPADGSSYIEVANTRLAGRDPLGQDSIVLTPGDPAPLPPQLPPPPVRS